MTNQPTNIHVSQNSQHLWYHPYRLQTPPHPGTHPRGARPLNILAHIDRIGFRVPEACNTAPLDCAHGLGCSSSRSTQKKKKLQRSLTPHLDCCPTDMLSQRRWRPIQCMLALTPTLQVKLELLSIPPVIQHCSASYLTTLEL